MEIAFEGDRLTVGDTTWKLDRKIIDAVAIQDRVFVIFDYIEYPDGEPAKNLFAFDLTQNQLWVADNPSTDPTDAWVSFMNTEPLTVGNFAGYRCIVDPESGKLIESVFTK